MSLPTLGEREAARAAPVEVRVLSSTVAHGSLGLGGDLGYEGKRVSLAGAADASVISAHGPSEVRIAVAGGSELRLRGAINDDARGEKIAAHFIVEDGRGSRLAVLGIALPGAPTPAVAVTVPPQQQLVLRCHATTRHACHALWVIEGGAISPEEPWAALRAVTDVAVDLAPTLTPGPHDAPDLWSELHLIDRKPVGPYAATPEADPVLQATLVERALREHHERVRVAAGRRRAPLKIAALVTVHPSDAEALDLCLERAAEVGALQALERLVVVEEPLPSGDGSSRIRAVCDRHGAVHRRDEARGADSQEDPPPTATATRALLRQLGALAREAPDAEWLLSLDPGLVLAEDLWTHLVRRGIDGHADVSGNLRADSRFDPDGHLLVGGAAFSSATALALGALAAGDSWRHIERHLVAESDARGDVGIVVSMAARLLGRRIVAPERQRGLLSIREVVDPNDRTLWEPVNGVTPLAFSLAGGPEGGSGRIRRLLERVRRGPTNDPALVDVSQMRTKLCRVLSAQVSGGTLSLDGTLGYDGGCCPRPLCHTALKGTSLLSAPGPSRLEIDVDEPIELFGFLNASARFDPRNPVEFWVDWNFIGETSRPGAVSSTVRLGRGPHVLAVACPSSDTRHTLWAMRPAPGGVAERRLTVVTVAAYPPERVPTEIGILARSAHKHGIHLDVCFVGEGYASHTEMKIRRLRRSIAALPGDHVLYTDARDCFFLADAARIERQFASLGAPVVASSEAQAWPISEPSWADRFPQYPGGCNWINAGQWMGERAAILSALETLEDLDDRARRPPVGGELGDLGLCRSRLGDDQLLWQVADLNRLFPLAVDHEGRLFRNVYTLDMQLVDNRDFSFDDGLLSYRVSGQQPCVLHFSGWGAAYAMHQWGARLGGY